MNDDDEVWKPVPGFPEILASDLGRVKRVAHRAKDGKIRRERVLQIQHRDNASSRSQSGYIRVTRDANIHDICLAEVMCSTFFPEFDAEFHQASFVDGNPANTALSNLILIPKFAARVARKLGVEAAKITTIQGVPA